MFIQDAPKTPDLFQVDSALQLELKRRLSSKNRTVMWPHYEALGRSTASELVELSRAAEAVPPRHVPFGAFGRRVDVIETSAAWKALKAFSAAHGIVATGYDEDLGNQRRVAQLGLLHLFSASSATYSCPLAMTDAAARVLLDNDCEPALLRGLLSRDPSTFITSGQWMTERPGGSDVGRTETVAREDGDHYRLYGVKWFTSATTSEMALTLARIDEDIKGSRGLSLFAVEVRRDDDGALEGIEVNRLKDKLGTKALPTAELTLDGLKARRIGEVGRGVATISAMLNVTRWYNATASASGMSRAVQLAKDYAQRREAFGRPLSEQPLHLRTLRSIESIAAGATAMAAEIAELLGKTECGDASDEEVARLRGLIPIAKLTTGKQAVVVASEALECFGGAGYVEDTGLPRMLRDAQVLPIWEGTTNVLSLDVLRAEQHTQSLSAVLRDLHTRVPATSHKVLSDILRRLTEKLEVLSHSGRDVLEQNARKVAMTTGHLVQAVLLSEAAASDFADDLAAERFEDFIEDVFVIF